VVTGNFLANHFITIRFIHQFRSHAGDRNMSFLKIWCFRADPSALFRAAPQRGAVGRLLLTSKIQSGDRKFTPVASPHGQL
jgi:hypothetical protein